MPFDATTFNFTVKIYTDKQTALVTFLVPYATITI